MEGWREGAIEEAPADALLPSLLLAYSRGERGAASEARLQLIITLESSSCLPPCASQMQLCVTAPRSEVGPGERRQELATLEPSYSM